MAAISSRVQATMLSFCSGADAGGGGGAGADGALFDVPGPVRGLHQVPDVDAGCHDVVRVQFPGRHDDLRLGDRDAAGGGHHRVEVAGGVPVDQVAFGVRGVRVDQGDVGDDAALLYVQFAV